MQKSKDNRKYKNYRPAAINCFYESPAAVYVLVQKNRKCLTARHRKYSMADKTRRCQRKVRPNRYAIPIPLRTAALLMGPKNVEPLMNETEVAKER